MNVDHLMRMTVKDLRALAERHGVAGTAKLRKDQLIGLLATALADVPTPAPLAAPAAPPQGSSTLTAAPAPVQHQGPDPGLPIPDRYGIDRIVLLVQDPHHVYAYWEIDAATYHRVAAIAGDGCCPVLVVDSPSGQEQREVDVRAGNYWLTVAPGASYRARLALRSRDGRLHALAADSNTVQTPAQGPSPRQDEAWMAVDERFQELYARAQGAGGAGESSLVRFTRRTLSTRPVAGDDEEGDLTTDLVIDVGDVSGQDRTSAGLVRRAPDSFSSHSLLSSGALSSFHLSSHTLSSHSLSSGVFSSHSRWSQVPVVEVGPSPGLTEAPPAAASPAPSAPSRSDSGTPLPSPQAPATGATPVQAPPPPPRPGHILGAETVKRTPTRRRRS